MTASATDERVAVIGAGIVGLCCAYYLQQRGYKVDVIDPQPPGDACSFGNAGVLPVWSCAPLSLPGEWKLAPGWLLSRKGPLSMDWRRLPVLTPWLLRFVRAGRADKIADLADAMFTLNNTSVGLYRELLRGTGHEALICDSCYVHAYRNPKHADLNNASYRLQRERGAPMRVIDAGALRELEPALSPEYRAAIVVEKQGRTVNPARLCEVIAAEVEGAGGRFVRQRVEALQPDVDGGCHLQLEDEKLRAARVVVAAGAWSHRLIRPLGVRVPLEAGRGYHLMYESDGVGLNNSVTDAKQHLAASSMEGGLRVSGMMEFAGLEAPPFKRHFRTLDGLARRMFPNLRGKPTSDWTGHRPTTPDTLPVIGALADRPSILLAFGHGQLGLTGAPMTGRIIAALASGEPLNIDTRPYRVERFA
jgi:D-amino-acid dehydrogenase